MKCNVGGAERAIRIILGLVILPVTYLSLTGGLAIAGYIVGGIALVTGVIRFCPVTALLGISTCPD
jgi:hypothetical protein